MAAFNFPNSPSTNDIHTENGVSWKWNGTVWKKVGASYLDTTNLNVTGVSTFSGVVNTDADLNTNTINITDGICHRGDLNTKIRFPTADTFTVETDGGERLRIDANGWQKGHATYQAVGINTFASWARTGGAIRGEVGYNAVTLDYMYFGTGTLHPVALRVNNTNALFIDNNRRVLIGTATTKSAGSGQYAKLNVEGYVGGNECFVSFSRAEAASAMSDNDEVANLIPK